MPGIPLSNRCQFCKRRKIKCDENWPRCGNCKRSNQECSGPPKGVKFVQNNCHSARGNRLGNDVAHHHSSQPPSPCGTLVNIKLQLSADGVWAFHQMKIVRNTPVAREVTSISKERLASKLSQAMSSGMNGLLLSHDLLNLMAARLVESTALSDALACLLATFANLQRRLPFQDLIDLQTYGRALKSLQRAFKDPSQQYAPTTLAAVTVIYQIEVTYDSSQGPNKTLHCNAIYSLMSCRGPPSLDDPLDTHLAFENAPSMLSYTLLTSTPNFYATPLWLWTLQPALDSGLITSTAHLSLYTLHMSLATWPSLLSTLKTLHSNHLNPLSVHMALDLLSAATNLSYTLASYDETILSILLSSGDISLSSPTALRFSNQTIAKIYTTHAMASLSISSLVHPVSQFLCLPTDPFTAYQLTDWASRIRKSVFYAVMQGPEGGFLVPGLVTVFGGLDQDGRKEVMGALRELEGWKYSSDKKGGFTSGWTERGVLEMVGVICGRGVYGAGEMGSW